MKPILNSIIDWVSRVKQHWAKKPVCNGDYYITDQKMFKSRNKWNDGLVPPRDLDDSVVTASVPTGNKKTPKLWQPYIHQTTDWIDNFVEKTKGMDDIPLAGKPTGKKIGEIYVGDIIGNAEGDKAIQIEITAFIPHEDREDELTAKVVNVGYLWDKDHFIDHEQLEQVGFEVGEALVFEYHGTSVKGVSWWTLVEPENKPSFDLWLADGKQYFEYRKLKRQTY